MTTHGKRKQFKPLTYNGISEAEELFSEDIRGLFKSTLPVEILGKQLRYYPVSLPQAAYMINFLIEAFAPLLMSQEERDKLNTEDLFAKVIDYVVQETNKAGSEDEEEQAEGQSVIGAAFASKAAIQYLFPVMQQCFPDLNIYRITNVCFLKCFNIIFSEMFKDKLTEE